MSVDSLTTYSGGIDSLFTGHAPESQEKEDPLGRDAFLTMLVAQMQHQDPLNPMEGADFSAQLAQFSSLEQMFNMNDNLEALVESVNGKDEENLLDYIGKEIVSENDTLTIKNGKVAGAAFSLEEPADVEITIYDSSGSEIRRLYLNGQEAGIDHIEWDGKDNTGAPAGDGQYIFEVNAVGESGQAVSAKAAVTGSVTGLTYRAGAAYLLLENELIDPATVIEVRLSAEYTTDSFTAFE